MLPDNVVGKGRAANSGGGISSHYAAIVDGASYHHAAGPSSRCDVAALDVKLWLIVKVAGAVALGSHGLVAVVAWATWRLVLGARVCSCRLRGTRVNLCIGDARGPVGGRW
jgi:hypothetical protein